MRTVHRVQRVNTVILAGLFLLAIVASNLVWVPAAFAAPGDSPEDPIIVDDCDELQAIGEAGNLSKHFKIGENDINCAATSTWNDGEGFDPIGTWGSAFSGSLDGNGKKITNLFINRDEDGSNGYGLFGPIYNSASISNLTLEGVDITGTTWVGGLAGFVDTDAAIINVTVSGEVNGVEAVGGVAGFFRAQADEIAFDGDVNGTDKVGGVFGETESNEIAGYDLSDSSSSGNISGTYRVGGLVGYNNLDITRSSSSANIDGTGGDEIGGLVGNNQAEITRSYSTGRVEGEQYVGGFVGNMGSGIINESYSSSEVSGSLYNIGGFVGEIFGGEIGNSYATGNVQADQSYVGGFAGTIYGGVVHKNFAIGNVTIPEDGGERAGAFASEAFEDSNNIEIEANFAAGNVSAPSGEGGFIALLADVEDMEFSNNIFDVIRTGTTTCTAGGEALGGCTGVNTEQMPNPTYFFNTDSSNPFDQWNFADVWELHEESYPCLIWQEPETCPEPISDGEPDGEEEEVDAIMTFMNGDETRPVLLEQTACPGFSVTSTAPESELANQDTTYDYASGFVGFTMTGCDVGETATVTLTFAGDFDEGTTTVRKYNSVTNTYTTIDSATKARTMLEGQPALRVSYQITDGGELDQDAVANGTIVDPVGLGQPSGATLASTGQSNANIATIAILLISGSLGGAIFMRKLAHTTKAHPRPWKRPL